MAYYEPGYAQNYAAQSPRGPVPASAVAPQPSVFPHVKRIVAFERTPLEAWQEYQDELARIVSERHAVKIQARARGMLGRNKTARVRLQSERVVLIQRMVRDKLARRAAQRQIRLLKIAALMAKGERKAVMKLESAFLRRRERKRAAAATIVQAHFVGLKTRRQTQESRRRERETREERLAREEQTQRRLVILMAKGEARAAMRIQYVWWQFRAVKLARDKEAQQVRAESERRAMVASMEQQLKAQQDVSRREDFVMAQPVFKKARSVPLGFQKKQMQLDAARGELTYWKFSESIKAKVKAIKLEPVSALEQRNSESAFLLVMTISASGATRATTYTFRMDNREASDVWLKHLRQVCRNARVIVTPPAPPV